MQDIPSQLELVAAVGTSRDRVEESQPQDLAQAPASDGVIGNLRKTGSRFWRRQISVVSGHEACRDHFGEMSSHIFFQAYVADLDLANERTFLGYLRTSSTFATLGVVSFQLFLLGEGQTSCKSQYGKGLAVACEGFAIFVALSGAWRFWRHQNAILRDKVQAGGWEVNAIGIGGLIVSENIHHLRNDVDISRS